MPCCQIAKLLKMDDATALGHGDIPSGPPVSCACFPPTRSTSKTTLSSSGMRGGPLGMITLLDKLKRLSAALGAFDLLDRCSLNSKIRLLQGTPSPRGGLAGDSETQRLCLILLVDAQFCSCPALVCGSNSCRTPV